MTDEEQLNQMKAHVRDALRKIDGARWYALDEAALDSLVMLGNAWLEDRHKKGEKFSLAEFEKLMAQIVDLVPSLKQERPNEPPPRPSVWKDEITGETPRNPWADPIDLDSQGAVTEADPELAAWLKATACGATYKLLSQQREAEAKRARLAAIRYGLDEHATNPWLGDDLKARAAVTRRDQDLADVMAREAKPVQLPWTIGSENQTGLGQFDKVPELAKLTHRARELQRQRAAERDARIKAEIEALRREQQEAEKMLHAK